MEGTNLLYEHRMETSLETPCLAYVSCLYKNHAIILPSILRLTVKCFFSQAYGTTL